MQECIQESQSMCFQPLFLNLSISLYLSLFTYFHDNLHGGKIL